MSRTCRSGRFRFVIRPRSWQVHHEEHTVRCSLQTRTVHSRSVVRNGQREMFPYGGKNSPVRYSAMWITHVATESPYGISSASPVRCRCSQRRKEREVKPVWYIPNNSTVYTLQPYGKSRAEGQGKKGEIIPYGWKCSTVRYL